MMIDDQTRPRPKLQEFFRSKRDRNTNTVLGLVLAPDIANVVLVLLLLEFGQSWFWSWSCILVTTCILNSYTRPKTYSKLVLLGKY